MALFVFSACTSSYAPHQSAATQVEYWQTTANQKMLLQKQNAVRFTKSPSDVPVLMVHPDETYQTVDGFGFTLTGGSVQMINSLPAEKRKALLQELFGDGEKDVRINYLRLSIGASDLDGTVFSYNDLPEGQTDPNLDHFSISKDRDLIKMLQDILEINPGIRIIATPWSAPVWMKDNGKSIGGSLKPEYYTTYAYYFVNYIQEMQKSGIHIDAVTPQNEPLHPGNNPSMYMTAEQQGTFIKNFLGPVFKEKGIKTKIVLYDHNCNKPEYPISILKDPEAAPYIDGSAFHLYEGDISALTTVHNAFPDKNVYFTEQWTGAKGTFAEDLMWHIKNVVIGSMNNWSKNALEWNLANDEFFGPHTPGGCTECKGALTIKRNGEIQRNVAYYIIAHASKFVPAGSVRIGTGTVPDLDVTAFRTPEGKTVLVVLNSTDTDKIFVISHQRKEVPVTMKSKSVATFVF